MVKLKAQLSGSSSSNKDLIESDLINIKSLHEKLSTNNTEKDLIMAALKEGGFDAGNNVYSTIEQVTVEQTPGESNPALPGKADRDVFMAKYRELKTAKSNQEHTLAKSLTDLAKKFNKNKFTDGDYNKLMQAYVQDSFKAIKDTTLKAAVNTAFSESIPKEYFDKIFK